MMNISNRAMTSSEAGMNWLELAEHELAKTSANPHIAKLAFADEMEKIASKLGLVERARRFIGYLRAAPPPPGVKMQAGPTGPTPVPVTGAGASKVTKKTPAKQNVPAGADEAWGGAKIVQQPKPSAGPEAIAQANKRRGLPGQQKDWWGNLTPGQQYAALGGGGLAVGGLGGMAIA